MEREKEKKKDDNKCKFDSEKWWNLRKQAALTILNLPRW